jgi:glyoxalase family protein
MERKILGIHHVTAVAGNPQRNLDFYAGVLGLRLVKLTVNFDDPGTYHFYYGDGIGRPGTILTFFPWVAAAAGRSGTGQAGVISLAIPQAALGYWLERFTRLAVPHESPVHRFDQQVVAFRDPDGLMLELVAEVQPDERPGWGEGPVPLENAIRGTHSVTLWEESNSRTAHLITEIMGFRLLDQEGNFYRYAAGDGVPGALVEVREMPGFWRAAGGTGTVHHVAWRTPDDAQQLAWRQDLLNAGSHVTTVQDRTYFRSIYYREPGGVLFEIATDPPGFAIDEAVAELGMHLRLPPWLESQRPLIERALPPVHLPQAQPEG